MVLPRWPKYPGLNQELHLGLQGGVPGPKCLDHFLLFSQAYLQRTEMEVEQPELEPVSMWDTGITNNGFTHCATNLVLKFEFLIIMT